MDQLQEYIFTQQSKYEEASIISCVTVQRRILRNIIISLFHDKCIIINIFCFLQKYFIKIRTMSGRNRLLSMKYKPFN
jgi:hypothetical protein